MYSEYDLQDYWWYQDGKTISGSRKKLYKNSGGLANLYNALYSTLKASGGDDVICVKGNSDHAVVQCGAGNDYVTNYNGSVYCSFYGEAGDDEFRICKEGTYADGGVGNDTFHIFGEHQGRIVDDTTLVGGDGDDVFEFVLSSKVTIEGGKGNNTYSFNPFAYTTYAHLHNDVVITDISEDDTIEYFADWGVMGKEKSDGSELAWSIDSDSGYVVLYDAGWDFFNVTLEGATDISDVAGVKYNATKGGTKTLGEIFNIDVANDEYNLNADKTAIEILEGYTSDTFDASDAADYKKLKTIDGSAASQGLYITANGNSNKIIGSDYDDTIDAGKGNDVLTGGDGADVFIYSAGKDVINDYQTGEDTIQIDEGDITKATVNSSGDVVFTIGKGTLTVKKAKGKELSMIDSSGNEYTTVVGGSTTLTVTNSTKSPLKITSTIKTVNASKRTTKIKITGNTLANSISGGSNADTIYGGADKDTLRGNNGNDKLYGEAGNDKLYGGKGKDSLWGGAGNDSLWGDAGKDTFVYKPNEGTDYIMDYESGDMLKILKTNGKEGGKFSNSSFKNGTLTLTISGGGKVVFDDVSKSDKFNINGTTYKISGSKLK